MREHVAARTAGLSILEQAPFLIAHRVLPAFLEAYFIVADRLAAHPLDAPVDEQKFLAQCVAVGRQYVLQKRLGNPECVSRELFTNALALAANRGLLQSGADGLADKRRRFAEEAAAAVTDVAAIGQLDYRLRQRARISVMPATDAIAAIEAGPEGPEIGAFFDFDGTLIDGYSAVAYFADRLRRREMGLGEAVDIVRTALRSDMDENEIAGVIGKAMAEWAGRPEHELAELWSRLFKEKIASRLFPEAWSLVKAHQKMGHTVAIASSATRYQAAPIAEELGIQHLLCTRALVRDGRLTGDIQGAPLWGAGKADALCEFAEVHGIELLRSYAYANGNEDIAFLKSVGHATAVNPKPALLEAAQREGWKVLRFPARRKASAAMIARSLGAYCALRPRRFAASPMPLRPGRDAGPPNGSARAAAMPYWRSPASTSRSRASTISGRAGHRCSCSIIKALSMATSCCAF